MMTDSQARERIVSKDSLKSNIFLNAGAGSGKTESLVRRVLLLIENGSPMDSIVAITFTKEAARMFYDRIGRELRKALDAAAASGDIPRASLLNNALGSIDQAFFGTIDSFCRKLLMEHPQEAGISSQFIPLEREEEQEAFYTELFTSMQRTKEPYTLWKQYDELRDYGVGSRDFITMIKTGWSVASFTLDPGPKPTPCIVDKDKMEECKREAQWLIQFLEQKFGGPNPPLSPLSKANAEKLQKIKAALGYHVMIAPYRAIAELNEFVSNLPKTKQLKELQELAKADSALRLRLANMGRLAAEVTSAVDAFEQDKYYKSILFIESFCTYIQEEMENRGLATFDSCLLAVIKMLRIDAKQNGVLTSYIQSRYHHFLVDEYQDTSSLQSELFFRLAADTTDDDWRKIRLRPGALFIVGDEKQAIYRFRGGDVDNYNAVRDLFQAMDHCEVLQLSCNFRSSQPMTDWFNGTFSHDTFMGKAFPMIEPSEKQKRFNEQTGTVDGVYRYKVCDRKVGKNPVPGNEETKILELIRDLIGKPIFKYDHKTNTTSTQPITYNDIMIITARKSGLKKYIQLLSKNNIPYSVAGNSRLAENPVLPMMERLLDAAIHPGDRFKKYSCLMNVPFSLTEREIYLYNEKGEGAAAKQAFELLDQVVKSCKTKTSSAVFGEMIDCLQSWRWMDPSRGDSMDTLYYGLELIRAEEASGKLRTAEELLRFIDEQLRNGGYEYEMAAEERSRGIKLLNLHKSKGLEAPVVILADAEAKAEKEVDLCRDFETRKVYIGDVSNRNAFGVKVNRIVSTTQFAAQTAAEAEKLRKEQIRLRYVAATRAENVLFIPEFYANTGANGIPTLGERKDGRWDSFLAASSTPIPYYDVAAAVSSANSTAAVSAVPVDPATAAPGDGTTSAADFMRVKPLEGGFSGEKSYETLNPSKVRCKEEKPELQGGDHKKDGDEVQDCEPVKSAMSDDDYGDGSDDAIKVTTPESWRMVPATVLGTAVHRLMQAMVDRRYQTVPMDQWKAVTDAIVYEEDVDESVREAAAEILCNVAETMAGGGYTQAVSDTEAGACPWIPGVIPQDLITELRDADEVYTELPFSLYLPAQSQTMKDLAETLAIDVDSDGFINGIMDLIYYKDGQWIICDYKTNYRREGLYGHYEGQLLLYREIAKALLGLEDLPQAYLYHIPCKVNADKEAPEAPIAAE